MTIKVSRTLPGFTAFFQDLTSFGASRGDKLVIGASLSEPHIDRD